MAPKAASLVRIAQRGNQAKVLARLDSMTIETQGLKIVKGMLLDETVWSYMINVLETLEVRKT